MGKYDRFFADRVKPKSVFSPGPDKNLAESSKSAQKTASYNLRRKPSVRGNVFNTLCLKSDSSGSDSSESSSSSTSPDTFDTLIKSEDEDSEQEMEVDGPVRKTDDHFGSPQGKPIVFKEEEEAIKEEKVSIKQEMLKKEEVREIIKLEFETEKVEGDAQLDFSCTEDAAITGAESMPASDDTIKANIETREEETAADNADKSKEVTAISILENMMDSPAGSESQELVIDEEIDEESIAQSPTKSAETNQNFEEATQPNKSAEGHFEPHFRNRSNSSESEYFSCASSESSESSITPTESPAASLPSFDPKYRRKAYGKRYSCENCGKSYSFPSVLRRHQEKSVQCKDYFSRQPNRTLVISKQNLTEPTALPSISTQDLPPTSRTPVVRDGVRFYQCAFCPVVFKGRDNLKKHELRHTGARPYECTLCGKAFRQSSNLTRHKLVHSEDRAHQCTVTECGRKFKTRDSLKMHLAILHKMPAPPLEKKNGTMKG